MVSKYNALTSLRYHGIKTKLYFGNLNKSNTNNTKTQK